MKGFSFLDIRQSSGYTNIPGIWMIWVMMNHDQPDQWSLFRLRIQATNGPKNHQGKRLKSLNVACLSGESGEGERNRVFQDHHGEA